MSSRSIHSMIERRSSRTDRSMPLRADSAWRRKLMTETPWTCWGYWKARKMPALPRISVSQSVMSSPLKRMLPPVTSYSGEARSVVARVDLPEPFGPMRAWTSPLPTVRSTPLRMSGAPSTPVGRARRPSISKRGAAGMPSSVLALSG